MNTSLTQLFSITDYRLALPMVLLTLFALGILLIDLFLRLGMIPGAAGAELRAALQDGPA